MTWASRAYKPGVGVGRDYYGIKKWLDDNRLTAKAVAEKAGVHPSAVSDTLRGVRNHRRILLTLRAMGCPDEILSLPESIKGEGHGGH